MDRQLAELKRTFGETVRSLRVRAGLSISKLADLAGGVDPSHVNRIELGESLPSLPLAARLSMAMNVPLARLFKYTKARRVGSLDFRLQEQLRHLLCSRTSAEKADLLMVLKAIAAPGYIRALRRVMRR